jgi:hypothetical protein
LTIHPSDLRPALRAEDDGGARQLLRSGLWICAVGIAAVFLMKTVFGGIGQHGPHTDSGWLALVLALMCLPFGLMLTLLGLAKWMRNRRMARAARAERNP